MGLGVAALTKIKNGDPQFSQNIGIQEADKFGGAKAYLTFDPDSGVPHSTNNYSGSTTKPGWDGTHELSTETVAPRTVKLVAVGSCRGSRYVSEMLISFPQFPYALASAGKVEADGELEVLAVDHLADTIDGVTDDEKKAGHVVSNSAEPDAVRLNPQVSVSGDVQAVGQIPFVPSRTQKTPVRPLG